MENSERNRTGEITEAGTLTKKKFAFLQRFESTLSPEEKAALDQYHAEELEKTKKRVSMYNQNIRKETPKREPIKQLPTAWVKKEFLHCWEQQQKRELIIANDDEKQFYNLMCMYFAQDPKFEEFENCKLDKGLLILSLYGTGKTAMMKAFHLLGRKIFNRLNDPFMWFQMSNCNDMLNEFEAADCDKGAFHSKYKVSNRYFDDFGTERQASNYGKSNIMQEILENRYLSPQFKTHLTSNLSDEEMEEKYGSRVFSRMHEMFNVIVMPGEDHRINAIKN